MRFFLIDRVLALIRGESLVAIKHVSMNDEVFRDHFPEHPIFPGVLIIEAMAQAAGLLIEYSTNPDQAPDEDLRRAVLSQIDKAKFQQMVRPGDTLTLTITLQSVLGNAARVSAEARVAGQVVSGATLTFVLMEGAAQALHRQRQQLYRIWTAGLDLPKAIR